MAAGEGHSKFHTLTWLRQPFSSIWSHENFLLMDENRAGSEIVDSHSDSGSERDETSRNVARWLESLPIDQHWCEAEEQIGSIAEDATLPNGFDRIGDTDGPMTMKNLVSPEIPKIVRRPTKKDSKRGRKNRPGTVRESTSEKSSKKKSPRLVGTVKGYKNENIHDIIHSEDGKNDCPMDRPIFRKPEVARAFDDSMSRAIGRYKRSAFESDGFDDEIRIPDHEPPAKRTRSRTSGSWNTEKASQDHF